MGRALLRADTQGFVPGLFTNVDSSRIHEIGRCVGLCAGRPFKNATAKTILSSTTSSRKGVVHPHLMLVTNSFKASHSSIQRQLCGLTTMIRVARLTSLVRSSVISSTPIQHNGPSIRDGCKGGTTICTNSFLVDHVAFCLVHRKLGQTNVIVTRTMRRVYTNRVNRTVYHCGRSIAVSRCLRGVRNGAITLFHTYYHVNTVRDNYSRQMSQVLRSFNRYLNCVFRVHSSLLSFMPSDSVVNGGTRRSFHRNVCALPILLTQRRPNNHQLLRPCVRQDTRKALARTSVYHVRRVITTLNNLRNT